MRNRRRIERATWGRHTSIVLVGLLEGSARFDQGATVRIFLFVVYLICMAGGVASTLFAIYYFFTMHANVKPGAKPLIPFTGPFQFFIPQLWNQEGNRARVRLIVSLLLFGLFVGAVFLMLNGPIEPVH